MLAVELVFFLSCIFYRLVPSWEVVEPKCLFWPCINFFIYSSWIFWKIYFWYDLIIPQPQSIPHWSRRYCNWCMCARQGTTALLNGRNQPANNMELYIAIPATAGSSVREDWQSVGVVYQAWDTQFFKKRGKKAGGQGARSGSLDPRPFFLFFLKLCLMPD